MAKKVEYKGYTVVQSDYNNHVMIADANGNMVMHAQCTRSKSEEELLKMAERYIAYIESSDIMRLLAESEDEE